MKARKLSASLLMTAALLDPSPSSGTTDCSPPDNRFGLSQGNALNLFFAGFTNSEIGTAIGYWTGCTEYGTEFPSLQLGGSGGIPVTIQKVSGNSTSPTGACGFTQLDAANGRIEGATITIWTKESDGDTCDPLTDSLAHELGHVLGLTDNSDTSCHGRIMGSRNAGGTRVVTYDDCAGADDKWVTEAESQPVNDPYCEVYCWTSCTGSYCPPRPPDAEGCPVLLDLEGDGIHLTGLGDPVWFDIDADGQLDLMSWTDGGEGMLVLDRNGNGLIDDGGELFGNFTRLSDGSRAPNGYVALAELDTPSFGGNEDGRIDLLDAAFLQLRVWSDIDHDGVSQESELLTLAQARVSSVGLAYRRSNRTDQHGNELRFRGRAWRTGKNGVERPVQTWDVFFLVVP